MMITAAHTQYLMPDSNVGRRNCPAGKAKTLIDSGCDSELSLQRCRMGNSYARSETKRTVYIMSTEDHTDVGEQCERTNDPGSDVQWDVKIRRSTQEPHFFFFFFFFFFYTMQGMLRSSGSRQHHRGTRATPGGRPPRAD
jgi:hypothetical protein